MDTIGLNNPNPDRDIEELIHVRKQRETEKNTKPKLKDLDLPNVEYKPTDVINGNTSNDEIKPLREALFEACIADHPYKIQEVQTVIQQKGLALESSLLRDPETNATALYTAIEKGSLKAAEKLLNEITDPQYIMAETNITVRIRPSKKTCLHILSETGDLNTARMLYDKIASHPDCKAYLLKEMLMEMKGKRLRDLPALHVAAFYGHTSFIDFLVSIGVNVNLQNNQHDTAVHWASRGNKLKTMTMLIELNADLTIQNDKGTTPLYWAVRFGFKDMVNLLTKQGHVDVNQRRKRGLVAPVVLAAAMGYHEILGSLLDAGADANTMITNGKTALHFAANAGKDEAVKLLIRHRAEKDALDDSGSTPLHLATKKGHVSTMNLLSSMHHANIDIRTKHGKTVWNFALEAGNIDILKAVVKIYRMRKDQVGSKLTFPQGKTPLHEAVYVGNVEKIEYLICEGVDPHVRDDSQNTFLHTAAQEGKTEILKAFLKDENINSQNKDGQIPIHLAIQMGHLEATKILVKKSRVDVRMNGGYTALHSAAFTDNSSAAITKCLVDSIIENHSWSLFDATDVYGNTPLHVAAILNHPSIIPELRKLNPSILNYNGDNPFHAAAKSGNTECLEVIFDVFNKEGTILDINQDNIKGETVLHIVAKYGNPELVLELIEAGADFSKKNKQGNTVLHKMAEEERNAPNNVPKLLVMYREIVNTSHIWWCIRKGLPRPDENSDHCCELRRNALLYLISHIHNSNRLNVLAYCAKVGALNLFGEIMNTDHVFRMPVRREITFDITNVAPDTMVEGRKRKRSKTEVSAITDADIASDVMPSKQSYLDIIVNMEDSILASHFLDVTPIKQLSENLFNAYQWIYILLMIIHIIYMSCLSVWAIPAASYVYNTSREPVPYTNPPTVSPFVFFLIWPGILLIFQVVYAFSQIVKSCRKRKQHCPSSVQLRPIHAIGVAIKWFFKHLAGFTSIIFGSCVIAWYILYLFDDRNQVYVLSFIMVLGWMFTIVFTNGFKNVHAFSTMLSYIIVRDVTQFLVIFIFVLVGFAFAIHSLFQIAVDVKALYNSPWDTIFLTFNLMLGMADLFDEDLDTSYSDAGSTSVYVKIVYLLYMILATIILLNLLIALLSDTYKDIKSNEGNTWRVNSVHMALRIEKWMPFLKKIVRRMGLMKNVPMFDNQRERYLLTLTRDAVNRESGERVSEITKNLQKLQQRMGLMEEVYRDMNDMMDDMISLVQMMLTRGDGRSSPGGASDTRGDGRSSPGGASENLQLKQRPTNARLKRRLTKIHS